MTTAVVTTVVVTTAVVRTVVVTTVVHSGDGSGGRHSGDCGGNNSYENSAGLSAGANNNCEQ